MGTISKFHTFSDGYIPDGLITAARLNTNWDRLYTLVNGNLDNDNVSSSNWFIEIVSTLPSWDAANEGKIYYAQDTDLLSLADGTELVTLLSSGSAGSLTSLTLDNNNYLKGKDTGGTARNLVGVDSGDDIQIGDAGNALSGDLYISVGTTGDILFHANDVEVGLLDGSGFRLPNNVNIIFEDSGASAVNVLSVDGSDDTYLKAKADQSILFSDGTTMGRFLADNLIIGTGSSYGTSAAKAIVLEIGTVPGSSPANLVHLYAKNKDGVDGKAVLHVRNEDGSESVLDGSDNATLTAIPAVAGAEITNNTEQNLENTSYEKIKEIRVDEPVDGDVRVNWEYRSGTNTEQVWTRIYINGSPANGSSEYDMSSDVYTSESEDMSESGLSEGDLIQIYAKATNGSVVTWVKNMTLTYTWSITAFGSYELNTPLTTSSTAAFDTTNQDP